MGREKRLRIAALEKERLDKLARGEDVPSVFRKPKPLIMFLRCRKCNHLVEEAAVVSHLIICQPNGAACGICKAIIKPADFLTHIKNCKGVQVENQEQKESITEPAKSV